MKTRTFLFSALALAASILPARAAVIVTLPKAGEYTAWVADAGGKVLAGPATVNGTKATLDTGTVKNTGAWTAVVEDANTGNVAEMKVPAGESPRLTLKADDFDRIGTVVVAVSDKDGKAPTYAAVTLTDSAKEQHNATLRPSDAGLATFHDVAAGDGSVRVQQGEPENQQTVTVRLPLERDLPVHRAEVDVALPEGMKTQDASPRGGPGLPEAWETEGTEAASPAAGRNRNPWPGFVVALVILAGGGFLAYRFLQGRGITAQSALARAGIQLPDDQAGTATVVPAGTTEPVDPTICPFCGGAKDPTGTCPNCAVGAAPSAAPFASPSVATGGRRLVALSGPRAGHVFPISGALTIGRETGQDVAITDDPSLSRHHAVIESDGAGAAIADQGSSNGTWVNGQRVQRQALHPGDEITLGASRFRYEE